MALLERSQRGLRGARARGARGAFLPFVDTRQYGPPVLADDPRFGQPTGDGHCRRHLHPRVRAYQRPAARLPQPAARREALGGEFLFNAEVVEILKRTAGLRASSWPTAPRSDAPIVVNAAGPHCFKINQMAGVQDGMQIKTRALKQEVCHVPAPAGVDYHVQGTIISDGDTGATRAPRSATTSWSAPWIPSATAWSGWTPTTTTRASPTSGRTQVMREAQRIPSLPIPAAAEGASWTSTMSSDDWLPIYDVSDLPGFYMAVGTSGNQFKNAPVVGKLMAELIAKVEAGHDHDAEPVQFALRLHPANLRHRLLQPSERAQPGLVLHGHWVGVARAR